MVLGDRMQFKDLGREKILWYTTPKGEWCYDVDLDKKVYLAELFFGTAKTCVNVKFTIFEDSTIEIEEVEQIDWRIETTTT